MDTDTERYSAVLQELYQRTTQGIKLGLDNTRQLLHALGNPQARMKHVVVAGTNGKGSTSSLLAAVCQQAGHKTGLYTSPHLLRFTERIKINNHEISQKDVLRYLEQIRAVESACDALPTFFEVTTAMSLLAFADAGVDLAIMEVGLGGRLDSTNVVDKCLSIITPIALDHVHILGDTIEEIAAEKAGIIASDAPALSANQIPSALAVLTKTCADRGTTLFQCKPAKFEDSSLRITTGSGTRDISFDGPAYQASNINTVAHALPLLTQAGFATDMGHLEQALKSWQWAGRFQKLFHKSPVILDGAHNPHALKALLDTLNQADASRPLHVVFSAIHTKDATQMVKLFEPAASSVHLCPSSVGKSLDQEALKSISKDEYTYPHATAAFEEASRRAEQDQGCVLVTGSLFLVADILHLITGERRDPGVVS